MKVYLKVLLLAVLNAAVLGISPILVSEPDWILFAIGILLVAILLPVDVLLIKSLFKQTTSEATK